MFAMKVEHLINYALLPTCKILTSAALSDSLLHYIQVGNHGKATEQKAEFIIYKAR